MQSETSTKYSNKLGEKNKKCLEIFVWGRAKNKLRRGSEQHIIREWTGTDPSARQGAECCYWEGSGDGRPDEMHSRPQCKAKTCRRLIEPKVLHHQTSFWDRAHVALQPAVSVQNQSERAITRKEWEKKGRRSKKKIWGLKASRLLNSKGDQKINGGRSFGLAFCFASDAQLEFVKNLESNWFPVMHF